MEQGQGALCEPPLNGSRKRLSRSEQGLSTACLKENVAPVRLTKAHDVHCRFKRQWHVAEKYFLSKETPGEIIFALNAQHERRQSRQQWCDDMLMRRLFERKIESSDQSLTSECPYASRPINKVLDSFMARLLANSRRSGSPSAGCLGVARQALSLQPTASRESGRPNSRSHLV